VSYMEPQHEKEDPVIPIVKLDSKRHDVESKKSLHSYDKNTKEILSWVKKEVSSYGLVVNDTSSFSNGEILLALTHRLSPASLDYQKFDKSDPISTLTSVFIIAEEQGIPMFLQPAEVVGNKDPRALLMYLSLFKIKMEESNKPPMQSIKNDIGILTQLITDCNTTVVAAQEQLTTNTAKMRALEKIPSTYQEEIDYYKQRATLMDKQVKHCFKLVEDLDQKNELLFEENKILNEKVNTLKNSLNEEQFIRKKS